jgi:dCTP deaminase
MIEHGQQVCKLTFERMAAEPVKLYGEDIGSNYQGQVDTLSKHFRKDEPAHAGHDREAAPQLDLFGAEEP